MIVKSKLFITTALILTAASGLFFAHLVNANSKPAFLTGNIMTAGNRTQRVVEWEDPVNANPGEVIEFKVVAQNIVGDTTASNVKVTASLPDSSSSSITATGTVSADNADSVSDTVVVNVQGDSQQGFAYIPGHARIFSPSCPSGCSAPDTITSGGINVGNLAFGESAQVAFKAYVTNRVVTTPTPTVTPTITPTVTPTVTPTITPTITPTVTPTPTTGVITANLQCPVGFTETSRTQEGSNIILTCLQQIQSQQQSTGPITITLTGGSGGSSSSTSSATGGAVTGQVAGVKAEATQLPKTGLPVAAWALSGLLPVGMGLKKFGGTNGGIKETANYLWQQREFLKG